ncbi:TNF receptor superfamily member 14 [Rhinolophus ferrumequinum]|uniref:TNF receptor superfamily member 14 n=1 Tax=Rhinolophus ferrumequinum TaxID=59479 RepID=A0A7J7X8L8_RHIFE|nr:tumor necrosis factor receptor superfamily member 14 isoform X2 [Rhinolophus ferrumequinum]KAF6345898.1 TNF receptor superfamily member 14 [Rhinolophus ferrumequinum]
MELLPGWGPPTWSPAPKADALSLALYFLLLGSPHCTESKPLCKEEEYPVGAECCPKCSPAMALVTRQKCSSTKNTVCSCNQGHFCTMEDGDDCAACRPHSVCRPGQRVQERGTERQDTKCADCPPGTFSLNGSLAECQPWTKCGGLLQVETNPGTSSTDATCSSWRLWVLLCVLIIGPFLLLLCYIVMKARKSPGGLTQRRIDPQLNRQRTEGNAAADQGLPTSQFLPDVTTVAVEETASMSLNP